MKHVTKRLASLMFLSCLMLPLGAQAQVDIPQTITIAGEIEAFGATATSTLTVEVAMFDVATGGAALWNEEVLVTPNQGYVELELGSVSPLGPAFEGGATHIEIKIGNETLSPRLPISALPYAHQAGNSNRLEGKTLAEIKADLGTGQVDQQTINELMDRIAALESRVIKLEEKTGELSYDADTKTLRLSGANLSIESNFAGTGNLLIGSPMADGGNLSASHSIIMGNDHGVVAGSNHFVSGQSHNVYGTSNVLLGGSVNTVIGTDNIVASSTGVNFFSDDPTDVRTNNNVIMQAIGPTRIRSSSSLLLNSRFVTSLDAPFAVLIGSQEVSVNPSAIGAVSLGGRGNALNREYVVAIGGQDNTADGEEVVMIGGDSNTTQGNKTITINGNNNVAGGTGSILIGGADNKSLGLATDSLIMGGSNTTCTRQNCSMFTRENATDAP